VPETGQPALCDLERGSPRSGAFVTESANPVSGRPLSARPQLRCGAAQWSRFGDVWVTTVLGRFLLSASDHVCRDHAQLRVRRYPARAALTREEATAPSPRGPWFSGRAVVVATCIRTATDANKVPMT
jgi:hypothetical protein